nr:uridine kinase [Microlunatus antarcticus]
MLAGPSGSGKSRLVSVVACPRVNLDDFYRDEDDPANPRTTTTVGADEAPAVDWDDPGSWDAGAALAALVSLCRTGSAEVPVYDIATSRRTGLRTVELGDAATFVAEGLFAPDLVPACRAAGLEMDAIYLDRPRLQTLLFRFVRDVSEHRKPVPVLLRRGLALFRAEPALRAHALAYGCRPVGFGEALAVVRGTRA